MNKLKEFFNPNFKLILIIFLSFSLISLAGCEALKKKFIRKHKGEQKEEVQVIFEPQEYPLQEFTNEELYQNHYLLWKSWKQELSEALQEGINNKKRIESVKEMIAHLEAMKFLLLDNHQKQLELFIQSAKKINDKILAGRLNNSDFMVLRNNLETLEKNIRNNYSYKKVKDFIKK
ncbi:MAG: hypothetical protein Q8O13_04770 [Candidatus Omnitrophota bacterium]|nr:hypothetical protein [Candidatus Omnitrophota bacterium]